MRPWCGAPQGPPRAAQPPHSTEKGAYPRRLQLAGDGEGSALGHQPRASAPADHGGRWGP